MEVVHKSIVYILKRPSNESTSETWQFQQNAFKSIIDIGEGWTCRGLRSVLASTDMETKV
jgi:hypothetical protein